MINIMWVDFLAATVQAGTPLLLAASGEMMTERSGVMNLGVEGMMLMGAVSGFLVTAVSGNHWWGVAAALAAGGLMALIHAFITITLRGTQVVSGLALALFGSGLSAFVGKNYIGLPLPDRFEVVSVPGLAKLPVIGPILFQQDALVYISFILVVVLYLVLYKSSWGLAQRAVGDDPAAADAAGINVAGMRYLNTIWRPAVAGSPWPWSCSVCGIPGG
jgi:simple sugar transport system permease protein